MKIKSILSACTSAAIFTLLLIPALPATSAAENGIKNVSVENYTISYYQNQDWEHYELLTGSVTFSDNHAEALKYIDCYSYEEGYCYCPESAYHDGFDYDAEGCFLIHFLNEPGFSGYETGVNEIQATITGMNQYSGYVAVVSFEITVLKKTEVVYLDSNEVIQTLELEPITVSYYAYQQENPAVEGENSDVNPYTDLYYRLSGTAVWGDGTRAQFTGQKGLNAKVSNHPHKDVGGNIAYVLNFQYPGIMKVGSNTCTVNLYIQYQTEDWERHLIGSFTTEITVTPLYAPPALERIRFAPICHPEANAIDFVPFEFYYNDGKFEYYNRVSNRMQMNGTLYTFYSPERKATYSYQIETEENAWTVGKHTATLVAGDLRQEFEYEIEKSIALPAGDTNGSFDIEIADATLLQRYLAEFSIDYRYGIDAFEDAADVNGDNKINIRDVTDIQRLLAEQV